MSSVWLATMDTRPYPSTSRGSKSNPSLSTGARLTPSSSSSESGQSKRKMGSGCGPSPSTTPKNPKSKILDQKQTPDLVKGAVNSTEEADVADYDDDSAGINVCII